jgi:LysR family transcriptional activator of nhaA
MTKSPASPEEPWLEESPERKPSVRPSPVIEHLQDLNFLHLYYFWRVVRDGSIATACQRLQLTQPTISAQIRKLEKGLGHRLFDRSGRKLVLTEVGTTVYEYAEDIFDLGRELIGTLRGMPGRRSSRLYVGVPNCLPKLITYRLLEPVLQPPYEVQIVCRESSPNELLHELTRHKYDVILADAPLTSDSSMRGFNHPLGECSIAICGTKSLAEKYRPDFPKSLHGAPFLLLTPATEMRRSMDRWFDEHDCVPRIACEFDDSALMKEFGGRGAGLFAMPAAVLEEVTRQYNVDLVGFLPTVRVRYYAITSDRKLNHPAVVAIAAQARRGLLSETGDELTS